MTSHNTVNPYILKFAKESTEGLSDLASNEWMMSYAKLKKLADKNAALNWFSQTANNIMNLIGLGIKYAQGQNNEASTDLGEMSSGGRINYFKLFK